MTKNGNHAELVCRAIFEQAAVGIARVASATGEVLEINQRYCEILGYTMEEMERHTLFELTHPDDLPASREAGRRLISGETNRFTLEKRYCRKDRSVAWVRLTASALRRPGEEPFSHIAVAEEITERKQLDEMLLFKDYSIDNAAEAIHWTTTDGRIRDCNVAACAMLGYSREEFLTLSNRDIDPDYSHAERLANLEEMRRAGKVCQRRLHRAKDGRRIPVEITSSYFRYHDREYVCSMVKDIGELVKAEKEASFYKTLVEFSHDPIYAIDSGDGGRMFYANPAACAHFGLGLERLRAMRLADWDPQYDSATLPAAIAGIRAGTVGPLETVHRVAGGRLVPVEVTSNFMEYDDKELLYGYFLDISERKAMVAALQESRRNLVAAQRMAHIGNCVTGLDGRFVSASGEFLRILGVSAADFPMTLDGYLDLVHPDDRKRLAATSARTLREHTPGRIEYRIVRPDGAERAILARSEVVSDASGAPDRIIITIQDITRQKRAEAKRLELEKALLHAQKLESLGIMAGGIAHDLNNTLTAIIGNVQLFLLEAPPDTPGRDRIEQAELACKRAAALANHMLVYSGRGILEPVPLDLSAVVRENAEHFRQAAPRTVTLTVDASAGLPLITADQGQVQQVVMSLLTNAAEAIGAQFGAVTVTTGIAECDDDLIQKSRLVAKPPPGRFCYVQVADTGCGMDEETRHRLFDPFFTTKFTGRGLGLAAVQGIVTLHRGIILVDSEQGRGTTVRVLFPAGAS
ncbi:PAS domain S-box protein [Geobacter sp. FeAm09]|uniref:PAS domain-containing sensor histidine kinase n=1 Tax=Geobacter sp. FeAm09 TaxID=2597769 RepID=UPI00143CFA40|nr:PAS domain S-box protein [Geobacter sp. FeAm09]